MITKFKIFEDADDWESVPLDEDPQIGDYVICEMDDIS